MRDPGVKLLPVEKFGGWFFKIANFPADIQRRLKTTFSERHRSWYNIWQMRSRCAGSRALSTSVMRDDFLVPSLPCYCCNAPTSGTEADALKAKEPFAADSLFQYTSGGQLLSSECLRRQLAARRFIFGTCSTQLDLPFFAVSTAEPHD